METDKLQFEDLPEAVQRINKRLEQIEKILRSRESDVEEPLDVKGVADFLGLTPSTVRTKASKGELPKPSRYGKRNFWSKKQLAQWMLSHHPPEEEEKRNSAVEKMRKARAAKKGG